MARHAIPSASGDHSQKERPGDLRVRES